MYKSFKQYLLEEDQNVLDLIKKDCKPFLSVSKGKLLYRGVQNLNGMTKDKIPYIKKKVRKDRDPLSSSLAQHNEMNSWFKKSFGINVRSESLFCFPEKLRSAAFAFSDFNYGAVMCIFPIGEFEIIWSEEVEDLVNHISKKEIDEIQDVLEKLEYTNQNPTKALQSESELMVVCDEYYAVKWTDVRDNFK